MSSRGSVHGFPSDTSREALRVQYAALRRLTPAQRLAMMDDLTRLAQTLAREGLKMRHPDASPDELDRLYAELVLGPELAARVRQARQAGARRSAP